MSLVKRKAIRIQKILKSAKGEDCTLELHGICNHNPETTVWAHSRWMSDGHGYGIKSDDIFGCYACSSCHDALDGRVPVNDFIRNNLYEKFTEAMKRSWRRLIEKEVLK